MQIATLECGDVKLSAPIAQIERMIGSLFSQPAAVSATSVASTAPSVTGIVLHEGESYAGVVFDAETGLPSHHLVLMAGEFEGEWQEAIDWAAELGGELPTRQEQSFLYAQLKRLFKSSWYWSAEQYSSGGAWAQGFSHGTQGGVGKGDACCAVAGRRLPI